MGIFDRIRQSVTGEPRGSAAEDDGPDEDIEVEIPLRPRYAPVSAEAQAEVQSILAGLAADGVDVDDLASIAALYERELTAWESVRAKDRPDHGPIVARIAAAIGEHLVRRTDLEWAWVTDAFGSALSVADRRDDFVVVPRDLVGVRWLSRTHGWVENVVGHLISVRDRG